MAVRALIIAIEDYPEIQGRGVAPKLPGTLAASLAFKAWLTAKWTAEGRSPGDTELLFLSEPKQSPDNRGATRAEILGALQSLKEGGQNATEELFFYFSGHGFSFTARVGEPADVLVASDFQSPVLSGHTCLKLDEIVAWLRAHLGPGRHFYFVDACRNPLDATQIQVGPLLPFKPQTTADAATFVMQSVPRGSVAVAGGPFAPTLLAGLKGKGRAKVWAHGVDDAMFVRYESLRRFVRDALGGQQSISSRVDGPDGDGESEAVLARLVPVPRSSCTVRIDGALPEDSGVLSIKRGRSSVSEPQTLVLPQTVLGLEPDLYSVSVQLTGAAVQPSDSVPVDLYEDQTLVFRKLGGVPPAGPGGPPSAGGPGPKAGGPGARDAAGVPPTRPPGIEVDVFGRLPPGGELRLRNIQSGDERALTRDELIRLPVGRYLATLRSAEGEVVKRAEVLLEPDVKVTVDLAEWEKSVAHWSIARRLPLRDGGVDFSESLGEAIADPDLDLWLALLGGGRILGATGDYSKIATFPLHDFGSEPPGASPVYILAGLEDPAAEVKVALSTGPTVVWDRARQPHAMPGIRDAYLPTASGQTLLSFQIGDDPPHSVVTATIRNRVTLVTLTLDDDGRPRIAQYILPLGHLLHMLPESVRTRVENRNHLKDVKFLARASRAFRKRRDLWKVLQGDELLDLLHTKWLDPIGCSLAAYELVRRGKSSELGEVVSNMKQFFGDFPDTWALARLYGESDTGPMAGTPLFLDGLRTFPELIEKLPLAPGHLDFTSPWTSWRAAVTVAAAEFDPGPARRMKHVEIDIETRGSTEGGAAMEAGG